MGGDVDCNGTVRRAFRRDDPVSLSPSAEVSDTLSGFRFSNPLPERGHEVLASHRYSAGRLRETRGQKGQVS